MTKSEFSAWVKVTDGSASRWTLDENRWHNNEEMLFYKGGQDGKFIWIYRDGMMHLGTYEDAFPHIGHACFQPMFAKQFASRDEAYARLLECGGGGFVIGSTQKLQSTMAGRAGSHN